MVELFHRVLLVVEAQAFLVVHRDLSQVMEGHLGLA
jgi:hypothetical protein